MRLARARIEKARREGEREVFLASFGLTTLPEELWEIPDLHTLDLGNNLLTSVPEALGQLTGLKTLYLQDNKIRNVPEALGKLTALQLLDLSMNQLTSLPEALGKLKELRMLYLHDNQLTKVPEALGQLNALRELHIQANQLTSVPDALGQLMALQELYLFNNQITSVPETLGKLTNLRELWLQDNQLAMLPEALTKLCKEGRLERLFLNGNPALNLPVVLLGPTWLEANEKNPPAKPADILDYYFSICGSAGQALREVKLILFGRGEVGKSSMVDVLRGREFVEKRARTDGVAITPWDVELADGKAKVLLWDFGGQEIMHGTHQFFLTHRSLYVVIVDGRHDRAKQDAEYWLKLVRAFGGESPVMVVMNRQKEYPFAIDIQYLADKYGVKLDHFFRTDCERPNDIAPLREAILEEVARMLATEERFPKNRWEVKTRLEKMKEEKEDYLSEERYAQICDEYGVKGEEEQGKLLRRLADLGTVVSFPDDGKLAEFSVLNPEWATDGIYRVVTNESLREEKHGQLRCASLRDLLPKDRWPKPKHLQYIVELMKKFELCFPVDDCEVAVLVPELLPDKTPPLADWDAAQCVVFHYKYTVLPHGVLPRFITRTHELSQGRERWRTGVVLADDGAEALVKADYDANFVSVWVRGPHADGRRALLKVVRHHFEHIHARIKELKPEELVAVPNYPEVLVSYLDLVLDERAGEVRTRVTIAGERVERQITELLNGVETRAEREKRMLEREEPLWKKDIMSLHIDKSIHIHGDVTNSQIGQTLTNCTNMIQQQAPGEKKDLLEQLQSEVKALIEVLPGEKKEEAAGDLEQLVKGATATTPNRRWYSVSAEGLMEASKFVKDFTGNIVGTVGTLGKLLWPDFSLPDEK